MCLGGIRLYPTWWQQKSRTEPTSRWKFTQCWGRSQDLELRTGHLPSLTQLLSSLSPSYLLSGKQNSRLLCHMKSLEGNKWSDIYENILKATISHEQPLGGWAVEMWRKYWIPGEELGGGTQFELERGLGSEGEGREAGKDGARAGDSGCQKEAQGCECGLCLLIIFPRVSSPPVLRSSMQKVWKQKSSMFIKEVKNLRHLNPEMPTLGLTPPMPQPQDAGFKTNFISSIYGRREAHWTESSISKSVWSSHLWTKRKQVGWNLRAREAKWGELWPGIEEDLGTLSSRPSVASGHWPLCASASLSVMAGHWCQMPPSHPGILSLQGSPWRWGWQRDAVGEWSPGLERL